MHQSLQRGEFRCLLEKLDFFQSASAMNEWMIKFSRRASRVNKNKSLHRINLSRNFTWKRCFTWITKSETFAFLNPLKDGVSQKLKVGARFHPPPAVSELNDKQPEKSSFSCTREIRHLSSHSPLQAGRLSFRLLFRHRLMFYWWWVKGSGIDCTSLMARGEWRQRFPNASPSVWKRQTAEFRCTNPQT